MISRREWVAFVCAMAVMYFSHGSIGLALFTFIGAWMAQIPRVDTRSAERRYRMRQTERRNSGATYEVVNLHTLRRSTVTTHHGETVTTRKHFYDTDEVLSRAGLTR